MKILLVVNSSASSVTARGRVIIQKALSADHDVTLAETTRRGNATRLAQSAAATGTELVVVLGGDGTLNEAANGLAGTDCALATLPGGSTNVFARTLGLPNDPVESAAVLLDALERPDAIRPVGLGSVNGRYFLFHTGVGFDAATVHQVEKRSALKRYAGHPLFVWAAVTTWMRHYDHSSPRFAVHLPDGTVIDDGYFTLVMNTDPYTFLGNRPLHVTDEAGLDQPLAALTLRSLGLATLLGVVGNALTGRPPASAKKVDLHTQLDGLRITGFGPVPYQVDGDYLGEATELTFKHEPEALRLLMP
ncbi:MAG: Diacylglycerol kinase [Actinomycetia bacterium]|nr:Diacylglycerol kinase [Actinomycetes bacterium]